MFFDLLLIAGDKVNVKPWIHGDRPVLAWESPDLTGINSRVGSLIIASLAVVGNFQ